MVTKYSAPKGPLSEWGKALGKFLNSHGRVSKKSIQETLWSSINQFTCPGEKPHLNSSRQIRIYPVSKDLLSRSFHLLQSVFNKLHSSALKSFLLLPPALFVLILSGKVSWVSLLPALSLCPAPSPIPHHPRLASRMSLRAFPLLPTPLHDIISLREALKATFMMRWKPQSL